MNIQQMHNRINLRLQKVNSSAFDNILPEEIDEYINHSIVQFIKDRFEPRSNQFGLGFEQSNKRIEDLRKLIKTSEIDTKYVDQQLYSDIYTDKAELPDDQFLTISVSLKILFDDSGIEYTITNGKREADGTLDTDYGSSTISAKPVQHDDLLAIFEDPFIRPRITEGKYSIDNDQIYSYTNKKFITDKIVLTYIRQPIEVSLSGSVDCDLSPNVHDEIVDKTTELILSDIEALGKQAQVANLRDNE